MTDTNTAAGISLERVSISFGANRVIQDVSLEIEPGEFFAFLGPSGSGKSTLLRAVAGFGPDPEGRILIGDDDVTHQPPWTRNVGMVFQSYALWPHLTVAKNVAFGLEERRVPSAEIAKRVDAALGLVGLRDFAQRRPSQLSGGQQQRVALARTIVVQPRVLLLDEPLSNLDANLRVMMRREIHDLQRRLKLTTVFVTHDQEEANTMADRMAVLDKGIIQQVGTPMELYDRPANRFVAKFLGIANLIDGRVEPAGDGARFIGDGVTLPLPAGTEPGAGKTALFRPQSLEIAEAGAEPGGRVRLDGAIEHTEFLGSHVRYGIKVGGHTILADSPHNPGRPPKPPGSPVALLLDADQIRVLAA